MRMTVQQGITNYLAKIEEGAARRPAIPPQTLNKERRQWIAAMRKYISLSVEGLIVSKGDMEGWRLEGGGPQGQGPTYKLTWHLPGGRVWMQQALSVDELTPPTFAFWWSGHNYHVGQAFSFTSLISALTYAQTGRCLT